MKNQILLTLFLLVSCHANAKIILPAIFANHMVLQQNANVTVWGWANPHEEITVKGNWDNIEVAIKARKDATWQIELKTPDAGGPYDISIKAENDSIILKDVLIGEVWLASGQSNMQVTPLQINNGKQEISEANYPLIRLFQTARRTACNPQLDIKGEWKECTTSSIQEFSAVAYFFARKLHKELQVPVGIINSSWGGTPIEVWVNSSIVLGNKEFSDAAKMISDSRPFPSEPGTVYNGMIAPLIPFRIAGVIWYQGETNTKNYYIYKRLFSSLIHNWRKEWNYDFPFYYVQIAPYKYGKPYVGVLLREAQLKCMVVPKTGMVVISDIGDIEDIHPGNKQDVGKRLANWALAKTYHRDEIVYSGPIYKQMKIEGNRIRISFEYAEQGLVSKSGELTDFQIAGEDGIFITAKAEVDGSTVIVYSKIIKNPKAVRFAWSNTATPNLFNKEGLPASSFRTDNRDME